MKRLIAAGITAMALTGCQATVAGTATPSTEVDAYTSTSTAATPAPTSSDPFTARVEEVVGEVLTWWSPMTGDNYDDVDVVVYSGNNDGKCFARHGYAVVCTYPNGSAKVAVDREDVEPLTREADYGGDVTLALFMAHEVGHIVTERIAPGVTDRKVREQRAECAAGVFMAQRRSDYGSLDELSSVALVQRQAAFDDDRDDVRVWIRAAFDVGMDSITAEDCIRAFPE